MDLEKLPLAERIQRCREGRTAYPEYIPSVIRAFGELPLSEYLSGLDPKRRQRLLELIGCPDCGDRTYQWAALRVCELTARRPELAAEAMCILAAPMERYDDFLRKQEAMIRA